MKYIILLVFFCSVMMVFLSTFFFRFSEIWYPKRAYYDLFEKEYGINIPDEARVTSVKIVYPPAGSERQLIMTLNIPIQKEDEFMSNIGYEFREIGSEQDEKIEKVFNKRSDGSGDSMEFRFYKPKRGIRKIVVSKLIFRGESQELRDLMPRLVRVYW